MALIKANRESIDDRFSVLGFTIRTEHPWFEVALAAHPDLLKAEHSTKRTTANFYASPLQTAMQSRRGEAVYLVPPDVVARFVGQPRLYFGMASYREGDRARPASLALPDAGHMYVSLAGLTERGLRRTARGRGPIGYGAPAGNGLRWGGDAASASGNGNAAPKTNGDAPATTSPPPKDAAPYSDGYPDELWQHPAAGTAPSTSTAPTTPTSSTTPPAAGNGSTPVAASQAHRTPLAKPFLVDAYDRPSGWWDSLTTQIAHFAKGAMWFLGVADTTNPPYSAICQIRVPDGSSEGGLDGTGFFIAPRLILTAAHVVDGQSELIIVRGKNGGGISTSTEPFGRFRVTQFAKHPSYGVDGHDNDMALICVPAAHAVAAPHYFDLVEELTQSRPEGVVVSGYAAWWHADTAVEHFVNKNIDPNRQHAHGGHIREIPTDGTFSYDLQTLAGTSGSPVYWIEEGDAPRAHLVGVHVAARDSTTNLGCRITQEKLRWIRETAAGWSQTLTFSFDTRALSQAPVDDEEDPAIYANTEGEPVDDATTTTAQQYRARSLDAPQPDYPGASRFVPAHRNNFRVGRRNDAVVDRIVIHITAGGPNINGTIAWFQNGERVHPKTGKPIRSSAHYIVGRDGEVVQMVRNADTAHHASQVNRHSIGIEHNANKPSSRNRRDLPPTQAQYEASARLVAWLCQQYGLPIDREHIVGHQEASPRDNHECPSSIWDWDYYMACVQTAAAGTAVAQGFNVARRQRASVRGLQAVSTLEKFVWPQGLAEPNYLVRHYIEAYDTRSDSEDSKRAARHGVEFITEALKSESGRESVGYAILQMTTAVGLQAFDLVKDGLPPIFYAPISTNVNDPPPAPSESFTMPRALPFVSQRLGMFMAWVDAAIQQATQDTAERIAFQKGQWDAMRGAISGGFTMLGITPGLGTVATFVGLALDAVLSAFAPDFGAEVASFDAAMHEIRKKYKALAAAALRGFIQAKLEPGRDTPMQLDLPLHHDVQAYLDEHSAHALRGWQNELVYLGMGTPATALAYGVPRVPLSHAQEIITPYYDPADPATALTCQADAFSLAREEWFAGVPNTTIFPHSAICLLEMKDASGGLARGTGFYIGRNRILTCGHNLFGQASVDIIPGKNGQGAGTEPFGRCTVTSSSWRIPASYGGSNPAFDLAVIDNVPLEAPNGAWFPVLEELTQSRPEGVVVCGYSSRSTKVPDLTAAIDGFKQHLHAGYIAALGAGDSTFDYPILTLKRASGSPVYYISDKGGTLQAYVVGVHTGSATEDMNRGCRLVQAKIDWIEGRTSTLGYAPPLRTARSAALRPHAGALSSDTPDYAVPLIPQPNKNACWAAAMAMLFSFRRNASFAPETLAQDVGASLATSYSWELLEAVRDRYGFTMIAQPSNTSLYHTPQQWADWLAQYGPLWVVIVGAPHAVVLAGIRGNLADPASVKVKILNPWDTRTSFDNDPVAFNPPNAGYEDWLPFTQFAADFGNMAAADYGNWRVLHLPAATATTQSIGRTRRASTLAAEGIATGSGALEPIEPTRVPGTRMGVMRGSVGACRWALDQLEGFAEPATFVQVGAGPETIDVTIDLGSFPAKEGEPAPLPLTVAFRGSARRAVGDVRIQPGAPAHPDHGLEVTARIDNDSAAGNLAAVKVAIEYRFTAFAAGAPAARIELRLLGDGRHERSDRWVNTAQAA